MPSRSSFETITSGETEEYAGLGWGELEKPAVIMDARDDRQVDNPDGVCRGVVWVEVDGAPVTGDIPIQRDGTSHDVRVILGGGHR